jgi:tetratricopeptide (TPR) repeat protein
MQVINNKLIQNTQRLNRRYQIIILLLLAFLLNFNTLFNEYAMDDVVAMTENSLVKKGINGIPEILTKDIFYGIVKRDVDLSGGRYRPIPSIIFAIEYQFFGTNPFISHLINVLLFVLLIYLLYKLLHDHIFKEGHSLLAFVSCLIFVVHPIHTEVIANVKSRDELLVFNFLLLSSFSLIHYSKNKSASALISGLMFFLLALLTRESAVPFIFLVPLFAYFFFRHSIKNSIKFSLPFICILLFYLSLRYFILGISKSDGNEILNYPYYFATTTEAFATKIFVLLKYVMLLIFPHPLLCDYGYNHIPYIGLLSVPFIISTLFLSFLVIIAILNFKERSIFSFCILFFFLTIIPFSNFLINIGTPLAERLLFQPSLAFCIFLAFIYLKLEESINAISTAFLVIVLILFSIKTVQRNFEWRNNETLFMKDVVTAPENVRTNMFAASQFIAQAQKVTDVKLKTRYYATAVYYGNKTLTLYRHYAPVYNDLGFAYYQLKNYFKAADNWIIANRLDPASENTKQMILLLSDELCKNGNNFFRIGNYNAAISCYKKSIDLFPNNVDAWYNLGGVYFSIDNTKDAIEAWQNVVKISPGYKLDSNHFLNK